MFLPAAEHAGLQVAPEKVVVWGRRVRNRVKWGRRVRNRVKWERRVRNPMENILGRVNIEGNAISDYPPQVSKRDSPLVQS